MIEALLAAALISSPAPRVREHFGNIEYLDGSGRTLVLSKGGGFGQPVLSPDHQTVAFLHTDDPHTLDWSGDLTSLWIADTRTGKSERLIGSHRTGDTDNFAGFGNPIFSLDGNFIYVTGALAAVESAVHQVSIKTGTERFVSRGNLNSVIRTGPYRGYLVIDEHRYFDSGVGSYDAVYVVRPDGKEIFKIPGSDVGYEDAEYKEWLASKGWQAW